MRTPLTCALARSAIRLPVRSPARPLGLTLTEMLIALGLVSVLAALAVPGYQKQQRQARRTDGQVALQQLQMDQARWRGTHDRYADDLTTLGWPADRSPQGHYQITIAEATSDGYTLQATPVGGQTADHACNPLRLSWRDSATAQLSAGASTDSDPEHCWRQ
jgi:type IV pilus assembly protein PilE